MILHFSCATTFDIASIKKIKKVAIVGFSGTAESGSSSISSFSKQFGDDEGSDQIYKALSDKFAKSLNWKVKSLKSVKKNKYYKSLYKKYRSSLMIQRFYSKGLLKQPEANRMDPDERIKLTKKLGVDGIVFVQFFVSPSTTTNWGAFSSTAYKARTTFDIFVKNKEESVWDASNVPGETNKKEIKAIAGFSLDNEGKAFVSAIRSSIDALVDEYQQKAAGGS